MKRTLLMAAAAVIGIASTAHATSQQTVSTTPNADGSVTTTTTTYYYDPGAYFNTRLTPDAFYKFAYARWDLNHDNFISQDEWNVATGRWYVTPSGVAVTSAPSYQTYSYWDKNGNGMIDAGEFDAAVASTQLYKIWDVNADNVIANDEYAGATFRIYDINNDGIISRDEWAKAQ